MLKQLFYLLMVALISNILSLQEDSFDLGEDENLDVATRDQDLQDAAASTDTTENSTEQWSKKYGKRLETIDGIEIASSYQEYIALALGDLKDRLKKSQLKLEDFRDRVQKRTNLLDQVVKEIMRRRILALKFTERDKQLRKRLIRNTEMKSAIQRLAEIAGYRLSGEPSSLNPVEKPDPSQDDIDLEKLSETQLTKAASEPTRNETFADSESSLELADIESTGKSSNNYTVYIQMAYNQINQVLSHDKQLIIELIRKKKTNDFKLKELEKLRAKVSSSLMRLKQFDENLAELIKNDLNVENILVKLSGQKGQQQQLETDQQFIHSK